MANLKTDYKDDILDSTQNTRRKFRMITNDDGTFSFEDVTDYLQYGDSFGALDLNAITNAIMNECLKRTDVVDNLESTATDLPLSANKGRELQENFKWNFLKQVSGNTKIEMPEKWEEAICEVSFTGGTYSKTVFVFHVCKNMLSSTVTAYRQGYYNDPNNYSHVSINCKINEMWCATSYNGVDKSSTTTFTVYYR